MRKILAVLAIVLFAGLLAGSVRADTLELVNGDTVTGEIILPASADGLNLHLITGKYQRIPWDNFSQKTLLELAKNPKIEPFVTGLIDTSDGNQANQSDMVIKPVDRLVRPEKQTLLSALFHSPVGLVALLLIYVAGIYAAYEIAVARAYPPLLVCGVSAVAPFLGQIVFLALPTRMDLPEDQETGPVVESARADANWVPKFETSEEEAPVSLPSARAAEPAESAGETAIPETQVFKKGQFMFNRRFFETKFPGFFGMVRRDADKHMVLVVRSARGEYETRRISKITSNEVQLDVRNGGAQLDVAVPFVEIQEVQLKHENA